MRRLSPTLLFPAAMLGVFFVIPFGVMLAVSFFQRVQGAFYEPAFTLENYARFLSPFFGGVLWFSLALAALAAALAVGIGFPFIAAVARLDRRSQTLWLVALMAVLSLSEVIIGFAWSTLFSRTAGISNIAVSLGLMEKPVSLSPGLGAVATAMVYQTLPFAALSLYPTLARLDPSLSEAARTMGATPLRAFFTVTVPACRSALAGAFILAFVFALGAYLLPQMLGRPSEWTLSVLIVDQAVYQSNMPFAAAMAIFLMLVSAALVGLSALAGRGRS